MAYASRTTTQAAAEVIRTETVDGANTPDRVGSNLRQLTDSAMWIPATASEHSLLRCQSTGEGAWTTTVWSDGTYIGVGATAADLPNYGNLRMSWAATATVKRPDAAAVTWLSFSGTTGAEIQWLGSAYLHETVLRGQTVVSIHDASREIARFGTSTAFIELGAYGTVATLGALRVASGFAIRGYCPESSSGGALIYQYDRYSAADRRLHIGDYADLEYNILQAKTYIRFDVGGSGGDFYVENGGPRLPTGKYLGTTDDTREYSTHEELAVDTGTDASPVAVVSFTIPEGYRGLFECNVWAGDATATAHDARFTVKATRAVGGSAVEDSATATPTEDPDYADVAITYAVSGNSVTLYKQNTSEDALIFAGTIEAKLAELPAA